jgi:hypothetical protein
MEIVALLIRAELGRFSNLVFRILCDLSMRAGGWKWRCNDVWGSCRGGDVAAGVGLRVLDCGFSKPHGNVVS